MVFHGTPQSPDNIRRMSDMDRVAGRRGWVVVYPQSGTERWAALFDAYPSTVGQDDLGFMRRTLDLISSELNIDQSRVYAAGFSNGALFTHRVACSLSERFAAVASVGATMTERMAASCFPKRPVPSVWFLGDQDGQFPWDGIRAALDYGFTAHETAAWWAVQNECQLEPRIDPLPDVANDGTTVERWRYTGCARDAGVDFYALYGAGHTWPGTTLILPESGFGRTSRDINASEIAVDFFEAYTLDDG